MKTKLAYRVRFFTDFSHKAERVISRLSLNYIIVIGRFHIELFSAIVLTVLHMFNVFVCFVFIIINIVYAGLF